MGHPHHPSDRGSPHGTPDQPSEAHAGHGGGNEHMGPQEAPHPHDASFQPLVDHHVIAMLRQATTFTGAGSRAPVDPVAGEVVDGIERHLDLVDWLAAASRSAMDDEPGARDLLAAWFEDNARPPTLVFEAAHPAAPSHPAPVARSPVPGRARETSGGGPEDSLGINVRAVRELYVGAVLAAAGDIGLSRVNVDLVTSTIGATIRTLDVLHHYTKATLGGRQPSGALLEILTRMPRGVDLRTFLLGRGRPPAFPPVPASNPLLGCLSELRRGTVGATSATQTNIDATRDALRLNELVTSITPSVACAGQSLTITSSSDAARQFPADQPPGYGVFFSPCGAPGRIETWSAEEIRVTVPTTHAPDASRSAPRPTRTPERTLRLPKPLPCRAFSAASGI